jgi:glycosyltransferase involved in cell wall biosynthesis
VTKAASKGMIGICHHTVASGDAIGNDIFGMCSLLGSLGFQAQIFCRSTGGDPSTPQVRTSWSMDDVKRCSLLLYHHSIFWEEGEAVVNAFSGNIVYKYHNVTPPVYFHGVSSTYEEFCRKGREQTERFVHSAKPHFWLADSNFNRSDLLDLGEAKEKTEVVAPFNRVDTLLGCPNKTSPRDPGPRYGLFVGRFAPNKGYRPLLKILYAFKKNFPVELIFRMVGGSDPRLATYRTEIETMISDYGLAGNVQLLPRLSQPALDDLFRLSHVYVCASEHEGFCVPLIESQAVGLPIVATNSGAKGETIGSGQLVSEYPSIDEDFLFYSRLIYDVIVNESLRLAVINNGYKNVIAHFTREEIENKFVSVLWPILKEAA